MVKSKSAISGHPSLTCKTSIGSEFDSDDFLNNFNLFDYLNTAGSQLSNTNYWTINGNYSHANAAAAAAEESVTSTALNKENVQAENSTANAPGFDGGSSGGALESRSLGPKTADEDNFLGTARTPSPISSTIAARSQACSTTCSTLRTTSLAGET